MNPRKRAAPAQEKREDSVDSEEDLPSMSIAKKKKQAVEDDEEEEEDD